ncbi:MAG TPA: GNAT family N-acetyltransferase [Candidatus Dormibacteraeota bacterium]
MTAVRRATVADVARVREILRRAFDADPVVNWVVRQDDGRERALGWLFRLAVEMAAPLGHMYLTVDGAGVALWAPPGRGATQLRHLGQLPGLIHAIGLRRLPEVVPALLALGAKHPRTPHWYLSELAVDPPAQGRGAGGALLRDRLSVCDREGMPAYLENSNPRNTPLYERHGFRILEEQRLGRDGPPIWLMWRDAAR